MKANQSDKDFYWLMRDEIHGAITKKSVHEMIKHHAGLANVSMKDINHEQLQELKELAKQFSVYFLDFEPDHFDKYQEE